MKLSTSEFTYIYVYEYVYSDIRMITHASLGCCVTNTTTN